MSGKKKDKAFSKRYGRKDGEFDYYTVTKSQESEAEEYLSRLVQACHGCIIVESCEQSFPRVLCEDLTPPIKETELIIAAIGFFFPHLHNVQPAFKCNQGQFCFLAQDIRHSISIRTLNIFDFEDFGDSGHVDLVWLGCFPMMRLLCNEVSSKVIEILSGKRDHDIESKSNFARTTAAFMESQKYFSNRWSVKKNGNPREYRVQQTLDNQDPLSRLVQICNGEIYVDHNPLSGPRLLCEGLQKDLVTDESLMFAAVYFFFPDLKCVENMRKENSLLGFWFRAEDACKLRVTLVFGKEDFGQGFNLLLLGKFQFGPSTGLNSTLEDMVEKLITLTSTANDFALLAVKELKHIQSQNRQELGFLGMPDDVDLIMTDVMGRDDNEHLITRQMLWPHTELTRLILEGGGTVYDYRKDRDKKKTSLTVCNDMRSIVNLEEFMRTAIRDIYPAATDVRLACDQPLARQCWTLRLNNARYVFAFSICKHWEPRVSGEVIYVSFYQLTIALSDLNGALENVNGTNYPRLLEKKSATEFAESLVREIAKIRRARKAYQNGR